MERDGVLLAAADDMFLWGTAGELVAGDDEDGAELSMVARDVAEPPFLVCRGL